MSPKKTTSKGSRGRRGAIAVLAAFLLIVMLAMIAFAVDVGYLSLVRTELQRAADSAALAGAAGLSGSPDEARNEAARFASLNSAAGRTVQLVTSEDVQLGLWDDAKRTFTALAKSDESRANSIRVTCRRLGSRNTAVPLFFARSLGISGANSSAFATARMNASVCGQIIGKTKVTMSGSSHTNSYNAELGEFSPATAGNKGHVCSNGSITMSGSSGIYGDAKPGPGYSVSSSSSVGVVGKTTPLTEPLQLPPIDPGNSATQNDNGRIPLSDGGKNPLNSKGEFTLSGGDRVVLSPGTYYFSKLTLSGGSAIEISGPTIIYVTGDCSMSGGSLTNTTLLPKNLQLFPMGAKCVISGSSEFYGVVYGPNAKVERSGDSNFYGMIVGNELVLSGSGGIYADQSLSSLKGGPQRVTLVQ